MANRRAKELHAVVVITLLFMITLMTTTMVHAASIDEAEPNNSRYEAMTISMGVNTYGSTTDNSGNDKEDYFKFTAPISGTAKVTAYADYAKYQPDITGVKMQISDANNLQLADVFDSCSTDSGATVTFPVTSGKTYYIRCCGSYYNFYEAVDYHFSVGYSIGKTTIKTVRPKKKSFTVTWNKKANASFYQVQYIKKSVYQDYGWSKAKVIKVSNKYKSKTIKKLAKKKQYFVRVRVARTIKGVTYYSAWSPRKSIKTK